MKALSGLFQRLDSQHARREIDDELNFHLDLLTDELCRHNMHPDEARAKANAQFGNAEHIRNECVEIRMRNSPHTRALKFLLILVFLTGVLLRALGIEYHVSRIGDILIVVGLLGRLLLYLRGLSRARFFSEPDAASQLNLSKRRRVVAGFDQNGRTPVERLISEK
ncbi:MAG TPA: permease prefix domain 1-containing protein [Pyrinomonadaceae bacterium]|nr:permease prefix domain 1-containing protein [Pyrinomonadaceae bacterium]